MVFPDLIRKISPKGWYWFSLYSKIGPFVPPYKIRDKANLEGELFSGQWIEFPCSFVKTIIQVPQPSGCHHCTVHNGVKTFLKSPHLDFLFTLLDISDPFYLFKTWKSKGGTYPQLPTKTKKFITEKGGFGLENSTFSNELILFFLKFKFWFKKIGCMGSCGYVPASVKLKFLLGVLRATS